MGECPNDPPTVAVIEFDRLCIRLDDAKMRGFMAASNYFSLGLREQTPAYPIPPVFAKHP